jgi:hypothetical protein
MLSKPLKHSLFATFVFSSLSALSSNAQTPNLCCDAPLMSERIEQATRLKGVADDYIRYTQGFHEYAEKQILEAQKLEGEAKVMQGVMPVIPNLKMNGPQYQEAVKQYSDDLSQFVGHASTYNGHMQTFDREMGQCHANEDKYLASLKEYELHLEKFHVPNLRLPDVAMRAMPVVRPPHICHALVMSEDQARSMSSQYFNDQLKLLAAEQSLNHAEGQLRLAQQGSNVVNAKLNTEILRQKREQELAMEFGKLKEEYDLLLDERNRIATINKPAGSKSTGAVITKVQGKIKNTP